MIIDQTGTLLLFLGMIILIGFLCWANTKGPRK